MSDAVRMVELWRGDLLESVHAGHAVICDSAGNVVEAWGDAGAVIYPRSSCKMIQALPLVESGAGDGLSTERLALACASHQGAPVHTGKVEAWLADMGLSDADLRCGPEASRDPAEKVAMIRAEMPPRQCHNNCSGKHAGFLALNRAMGGDPEYVDPDHPVQRAVRAAFEEVTGEDSPGYGIDGCSAPNFATTMTGLARAMARFAVADAQAPGARTRAMARLRDAMVAHPLLVAGDGRACTGLMQSMDGVAVKTGAEGVFVAMLPRQGLGVAVKIADGATRASECAVAALLVRLGVLDAEAPTARALLRQPVINRAGREVGRVVPAAALA